MQILCDQNMNYGFTFVNFSSLMANILPEYFISEAEAIPKRFNRDIWIQSLFLTTFAILTEDFHGVLKR